MTIFDNQFNELIAFHTVIADYTEVKMATFTEANQVRLALKMKLSQYAWYSSSRIFASNDDFAVLVYVKQIDNTVRKVIPPVIDSISIKVESE